MNELEYYRDIKQATASADTRIAVDDGIPNLELNEKSVIDAISDTICRGTYSYEVLINDGELTKVAIEVIKGPCLKNPGF